MTVEHLRTVFLCRELSSALMRLSSDGLTSLRKTLDLPSGAGQQLALDGDEDDVSSQLAQVVSLVLKDLEAAEYPFPTAPTDAGIEALAGLQRAVFGYGGSALPQLSLMQSVFRGTMAQAERTLQLCIAALLDALAPATCLGIYNVASSCSCAPLCEAARVYALSSFSAAARLDYAGLTQLPAPRLMGLLCSDELQVNSELDVFFALVSWVEHDPGTRLNGFARRLAAAVRLPLLSVSDLVLIDSHPLVEKDRMALQVVAHTYLSSMAGLACDMPFGLRLVSRPRRPLTAPPRSDGGSSAMAALVQTLAAADAARTASAAAAPATKGPGTSTPAPADVATPMDWYHRSMAAAGSSRESLLAALTPTLHSSASANADAAAAANPAQQPLAAAGGSKTRDMMVQAHAPARRTLQFMLSPCFGASGTCVSPPRRELLSGDKTAAGAASRGQLVLQQEVAPVSNAAVASKMGLEMMLSPSKPGVRQWLTCAEAQEQQQQLLPSRKKLRWD